MVIAKGLLDFFLICDSRNACCRTNILFPVGSVEILRGTDKQAFLVENGSFGWREEGVED